MKTLILIQADTYRAIFLEPKTTKVTENKITTWAS
jgi:hypothetical protein